LAFSAACRNKQLTGCGLSPQHGGAGSRSHLRGRLRPACARSAGRLQPTCNPGVACWPQWQASAAAVMRLQGLCNGHESALLEQVIRVAVLRRLRGLRRCAARRYRQHHPLGGEPLPHRRRLAWPHRHLRCTCPQCWQLQQPRNIGDFLRQQRAGPQGSAVSAGVERQVHSAQQVALAAVPVAVGGCLLQQLGRTPVRRRPTALIGLRRLRLHVVSDLEVLFSIEYEHRLGSIDRCCELILRLFSMLIHSRCSTGAPAPTV
jgi:hypothetical protein